MLKVGDKVKLNIQAIESNGMSESRAQRGRFLYILGNPDNVYEVSHVATPGAMAQIRLKNDILKATSFFEDEVILIERS